MSKRVYEAAKDYNVPVKKVLDVLKQHNIKATNFSGVDAHMEAILTKNFSPTGQAKKKSRKNRDGRNRSSREGEST